MSFDGKACAGAASLARAACVAAVLALAACRPDAAAPLLDLSQPPEHSFTCQDPVRCWSSETGWDGWRREPTAWHGPPLSTKAGTTLVVRVRSSVPVRVGAAGPAGSEELARLEPQRPWSHETFAVALPEWSAPRTLELSPEPGRGGRAPEWELTFAELLSAGGGRCYREHRRGAQRLVDAVACVGSAGAKLDVDAEARSVRLLTLGDASEAWRLSLRSSAGPPIEVDVEPGSGWRQERIPLAGGGSPNPLEIRTEGPPGALLVWSAHVAGSAASAERPNVLVYLVDTLRADALGAYGAHRPTPSIDALALEGALFEQAFAPSSWTLPSVTSVLTGRQVIDHGVVYDRDALAPGIATLAERFAAAGHATAAVTASLWVGDRHATHRGFQELFDISPGRGPWGVRTGTTSADANEHVLPWLEHHAADPFFLYVHVVDPHQPYTPPESFVPEAARRRWPEGDARWRLARGPSNGRTARSRSDVEALEPAERDRILGVARELYDAAVLHADHQLGRILAALEQLDLRRRTLVVVSADHGEEFGEHARTGHAHSLYGEVTRVPLIFSLPGRVGDGIRVSRPVGLVDVAATLLDLAGVADDGPIGGRSLAPWMLPGGDPSTSASPVLLLHRPQGRGRRLAGIPDMDAVVHGRWKLTHNRDVDVQRPDLQRPEWELVDLLRDPAEADNRADAEPELRAELAERLEQLLRGAASASAEPAGPLDDETRERLRALGYLED